MFMVSGDLKPFLIEATLNTLKFIISIYSPLHPLNALLISPWRTNERSPVFVS